MRRTPVAGILEYIIFLLYLPFFTIWVSATKQASDTHKLFSVWVSATKQASHTHKLFSVWVSATKQASDTHKLFSVWVSATKQASHTHKLFTLRRKKGTGGTCPVYGSPTLRAMHSIHKCVAKDAPHLLAALRNEPRYS